MTPALAAARSLWPEATIDVLVRGGTEGILKGSLALDNIYMTAAPEAKKRPMNQFLKDVRLIKSLRKNKYDWIFELSDNDRGRVMTALIGAKERATQTFPKRFPFWAAPIFNHKQPFSYNYHRCEKDVAVLREFCAFKEETPAMQFDRSFVDWSYAQTYLTEAPIVLHPVTRWKRKTWPLGKWRELAKELLEVAPLVVSCGPSADEVEMTRQITDGLPRTTLTEGKLTWPQMAGLLYSARLLVSVDTATMHLGAACQTPLVAIFGPTVVKEWGPWACPHELVAPERNDLPPESIITSIGVDRVRGACERMLAKAGV